MFTGTGEDLLQHAGRFSYEFLGEREALVSVQGHLSGDGKVSGESYQWLEQSLQHSCVAATSTDPRPLLSVQCMGCSGPRWWRGPSWAPPVPSCRWTAGRRCGNHNIFDLPSRLAAGPRRRGSLRWSWPCAMAAEVLYGLGHNFFWVLMKR